MRLYQFPNPHGVARSVDTVREHERAHDRRLLAARDEFHSAVERLRASDPQVYPTPTAAHAHTESATRSPAPRIPRAPGPRRARRIGTDVIAIALIAALCVTLGLAWLALRWYGKGGA